MAVKPESEGYALAIGRYWIDRDPLYVLKDIRASVGWRGGKWVIEMSDERLKRLDDCIAFNEGRQN